VTGAIVSTSAAQAQAACNACHGAGACVAGSFGNSGGAIYVKPGRGAYVYQAATKSISCVNTSTTYVPQPGDILDNAGCPLVPDSRWAD